MAIQHPTAGGSPGNPLYLEPDAATDLCLRLIGAVAHLKGWEGAGDD
jgi:hypothetical protein